MLVLFLISQKTIKNAALILWADPKTKNATPDIGPEWRFVQIIRPRAVLRGPESGGNREKNLEHKAQFLQPGADTIPPS